MPPTKRINKRMRKVRSEKLLEKHVEKKLRVTESIITTVEMTQAALLSEDDRNNRSIDEDTEEEPPEESWEDESGANPWATLLSAMNGKPNDCHLRKSHTGNSYRTHARQEARQIELGLAARACHTSDGYFVKPVTVPEDILTESQEPVEPQVKQEYPWSREQESAEDSLVPDKRILDEINDYLADKKTQKTVGEYERTALNAVCEYLRRRLRTRKSKIDACMEVALYKEKSIYWANNLVQLVNQWKLNKHIILTKRGKHPKTNDLLAENDISLRIQTWLRVQPTDSANPRTLRQYVNDFILPRAGVQNKRATVT
ncbi:hypothetical protein BGX26_000510, partial [Mortierella sp. AD094]